MVARRRERPLSWISRSWSEFLWDPVVELAGIEIARYQVIVELPEPLRVFSVDLPASVTAVTVPPEFLGPGTE